MKTCKDCIHFDVCNKQKITNHRISQSVCNHFKDKSLVLDLPCKVGDTVYVIFSQFKPYINECSVDEFLIRKGEIFAVLDVHYPNYIARRKTSIPISWFNRFAFTKQEEAEQTSRRQSAFNKLNNALRKQAAEQALKEREQG